MLTKIKEKKGLYNIWHCLCRMDNDLIDGVKSTETIPHGGKAYIKQYALN